MKKNPVIFLLLFLALASCTKTQNATNNYTTIQATAQPAFSVNGIKDVTFTNWFVTNAAFYISVEYLDSAQETVTLSLSQLPAGIAIDTNWPNSGIPTFATVLTLYDTTLQGATPGTYPMTLTATTTSGKQKAYQFNIRVLAIPTNFLGKYSNCFAYCDSTVLYSDSVYRDPVILNKLWFANYANCGQPVYGIVTLPGSLNIPDQVIAGHTYNGQGSISADHFINISITTSCALNMR